MTEQQQEEVAWWCNAAAAGGRRMAEPPPLSHGCLPRRDGKDRGSHTRPRVPAVAARPAAHALTCPRQEGAARGPHAHLVSSHAGGSWSWKMGLTHGPALAVTGLEDPGRARHDLGFCA